MAIFQGLSDSELETLNRVASIRFIQPADYLLREGDTDQSVFVIIDGQVKVFKMINGTQKELAVLTAGDWIGEISFTRKIPRTASAIAMTHTHAMVLDTASLIFLEDHTQLNILKQLNDLASERISNIVMNEKRIEDENEYYKIRHQKLIDYITAIHENDKLGLNKSDAFKRMIQSHPCLPLFHSALTAKLITGEATQQDVAELLKTDPCLHAYTLKLVNECKLNDKPVPDISQAMIVLGMAKLYQLIRSENISQTAPLAAVFTDIQTSSIGISCISHELSTQTKIGSPALLLSVGLLHDIGSYFLELLKAGVLSDPLPITSADSAIVGAFLLRMWNIPETICRCIELQRFPEFCPPVHLPEEYRDQLAIMYVSRLCYKFLRGWTANDLPTIFWNDYIDYLGWENLSVAQLMASKILPCLIRKKESFPELFARILNSYLETMA